MSALEHSRLPSSAAATSATVAPTPAAPTPAPAPAPSTVEVAISSSQQAQLLEKLGMTSRASLSSRALRCALRGLTEEDCAVLSHCATCGSLVDAMPSLQLIDLGYNSIDDEGLRRLAGLLAAAPALEKLSLYENKASSLAPIVAALHAHGGPSLRVLNLAWNRLHSAGPRSMLRAPSWWVPLPTARPPRAGSSGPWMRCRTRDEPLSRPRPKRP